ncbi:MAG: serine/threonine-protein kinase [Nannocystaceae bacterium]|nr:serine/threonine protein kinase [bacterium]
MSTDEQPPAGLDDTLAADSVNAEPAGPGRSPSQQRLHEEVRGRLFEGKAPSRSFEPGAMVAGRYQIVGLLGTGGMGEVFRARDLVLDEDVAIKFLPEARAHDESFMRRFVNEVRLARQISHPAVCRVHDIGEVDGRAFLSMEYIDGEDLASLLRRIGRLPPEKGYELAQQLCAGLSELHSAGLLHRDLKPANIMIDGHGRLKLADFGLAAVREELRANEYGDGTPAYMAPEQLEGRGVSERSDIYALGVVLYELLSGRHPHEARAGATGERGRIDRTAPAVELATRVSGLAEETLEIVERCLEDEPAQRPASVLDVAAALPGGDPIAAALRAGRAPSVDAVANASAGSGLQPWQAWGLAAFTVLVAVLYAGLWSKLTVWGASGPQLAPAVLEARAKDVLSELSVELPEGDDMHRFFYDAGFRRASRSRRSIAPDGFAPVLFEYRASPTRLARVGLVASDDDPPMKTPGEVRVVLDVRGQLRGFERVPQPEGSSTEPVDWPSALSWSGLVDLESSNARVVPPRALDQHEAWQARLRDGDETVRVEAASWKGQPVWLRVEAPWTPSDSVASAGGPRLSTVQTAVALVFFTVLVLLARRMVVRDEADVRGALRVAITLTLLFSGAMLLTSWVGQTSGIQTLFTALSQGLLIGAIALLGYAVIEPYGRRLNPNAMVSWIRLTRGRWRDPAVGRDALIGAALGGLIAALVLLRVWLEGGQGAHFTELDAVAGPRHALGAVLGAIGIGAYGVMQVYVLFLALRWILRRTSFAAAAFAALWTALEVSRLTFEGGTLSIAVGVLVAVATSLVVTFVLVRRGLLTLSILQVMINLLLAVPLTLDLSGWYAASSVLVLGTIAVVSVVSVYVALGGGQAHANAGARSRTSARGLAG